MKSRCWRVICVVGAATIVTCLLGCEGLQEPPAKQAPIATAPPPQDEPLDTTDLKPRKAALPKLPPGVGKIDEDAPDELTPTASGLYYRILRKSDGRKPEASNTVLAHYRGTLDNGTQFDSSYDRHEPSSFGLRQVIPGWTEGLQLIGEGGMIELEIPYQLGYGASGNPPKIPPKATLHFLVELKEVQ